ncbi:MAG: PEP-CTERM sorting domain-containing protein [Myxococcota bacterium]
MIPHFPKPTLRRVALAFAALLGLALPAGSATINDGTASLTVSDTHGGATDYVLGGTDHLFQADFYFRTGSMTAEEMMTGVNSTYVNSVSASGLEITVTGSTSEFDFTLIYGLDGAGRMTPSLDITNTSGSQLDITVFNYQDWDVNGTAGGDSIIWNGFDFVISQGATSIQVTPAQTPTAVAASGWPTLRNSLRDGSATTLTDGAGLPFGPGDGTLAAQHDLSIADGDTGSVIYTVPEPSTGAMGLLGLAGLAWASRRRPL